MRPRKSPYEALRQTLIEKLTGANVEFNVVVMPDFFLDHSLVYGFDAQTLSRRMLCVASRGGGEIANVHQSLDVGGNAAICTMALASLGADVHPIMKTDKLGFLLMRHFYNAQRVDLSRIKLNGSLSPTAILELRSRHASTNVMLGDASSISPFGFEDLDSDDLAIINRSQYVCVFNWLYNKKGTELTEKTFQHCRAHSKARTFFDAADPTPRSKELNKLDRRVLRKGLIDMWGMNENEALVFAKLYKRGLNKHEDQVVLEAGKTLSHYTGVNVYLHTAEYAASIIDKEVVMAPTFAVTPRRGTGAGDSWNAAIIVADALELPEEEALLFANAVAGKYSSNPQRVHSTIRDIVSFLKDSSVKLKPVRLMI